MIRYIVTLMVIVVLVAVVWLVEINQGSITVNLTPTKSREIATASFFLLSLATGAGFVFLIYFMRDVRRFLRGLKVQREQKKRSKIQELYTKGLGPEPRPQPRRHAPAHGNNPASSEERSGGHTPPPQGMEP
jgi:uncharacterized integral membrane protein